jgi:chromosome segregation ATPase
MKKLIIGAITAIALFGVMPSQAATPAPSTPQTAPAAPAPSTAPTTAPAAAPVAAEPATVTDKDIGTCVQAIMTSYKVTKPQTLRLAANTTYNFVTADGESLEVKVTDWRGIWGGCSTALADTDSAKLAATETEIKKVTADIEAFNKEAAELTAKQTANSELLAKAQESLTALNAKVGQLQAKVDAKKAAALAAPTARAQAAPAKTPVDPRAAQPSSNAAP